MKPRARPSPQTLLLVLALGAPILAGSEKHVVQSLGTSHSPEDQNSRGSGKREGVVYVAGGRRIKVEGDEFSGSKLIADEIELIEDDSQDLEVEGVISRLDLQSGRLQISLFEILILDTTSFEGSGKSSRRRSDLSKGMRVKVKAESTRGDVIHAKSIRLYESSSDRDFEIEVPIEAVDLFGSELSILSLRIQITRRTQKPDLSGVFGVADLESEERRRAIRRDDDEPELSPVRLGRLYVGGKVGLAYEQKLNHDLIDGIADSGYLLKPESQLELSLPLGEYSEAYAKLSFSRPTNLGNDGLTDSRGQFRIREAFVRLGQIAHPSLSLQVGRQRFRDKREWVYDHQLDAVRLHWSPSRLKVEVAAAKTLFGPTGSRSDQFYLLGSAQYRLPGRRYLSGYILKRNDLTGRDEDPIWWGMSSRGRLVSSLDYWVEASRMIGRRQKRLLRGYGYDLGGSYRFRLPWSPTLSAGYAFGSGDNNLRDGVDGNFRQTRLNDNSYRHNGLKRYRYYGILAEPELFNLKIRTLDLGLRPSDQMSINLAYHVYRQAIASRELGDMTLVARPNGRDPRLGQEIDVVVAIRKLRNADFNVFAGLFLPGPAFSGERARAFLLRPEFRYYF